MKSLFLVVLGGGLGSGVRYALSGWVFRHAPEGRFPLGTFTVNVVGCLAAGVLAGLANERGFFSTDVRLFLFVGLLGGFTTFSAFGLETFTLLRRGEVFVAGGNIVFSVVVGLLALWLGFGVISPRS
jgi:CrcB protein